MQTTFEYDVFLSFASKDEDVVRPIWQELSLNGLRIFWSDETLKESVGKSFFGVIQNALAQSKHLLLMCSNNSMQSEWVKLEYETFYSEYYMRNQSTRRLILFPIKNYDFSQLPPFLRQIQVTKDIKEIVPILGGVDVAALKSENKNLRNEIESLRKKIEDIQPIEKKYQESLTEINILREQKEGAEEKIDKYISERLSFDKKNEDLKEQIDKLKKELAIYKKGKVNQFISEPPTKEVTKFNKKAILGIIGGGALINTIFYFTRIITFKALLYWGIDPQVRMTWNMAFSGMNWFLAGIIGGFLTIRFFKVNHPIVLIVSTLSLSLLIAILNLPAFFQGGSEFLIRTFFLISGVLLSTKLKFSKKQSIFRNIVG